MWPDYAISDKRPISNGLYWATGLISLLALAVLAMVVENEKLKDLLVKYEQWEADIISNDEMWWPNKAKDSLPDEIYEKMLELQRERNELLKRFTPKSYKPKS